MRNTLMTALAAAWLMAASLAVSSCASAGEQVEPRLVTFVVENNVSPSQTLRVLVVPPFGRQISLGTIGPNTKGEFYFEVKQKGSYRLRATRLTSMPAAGMNSAAGVPDVAVSDRFTIPEGLETITWNLRNNHLEAQ